MMMFENRMLRKIFGPKWNEVTGGWRKHHNEELCNVYSSPSIIRMNKSKRMRWTGHVERMRRRGSGIGYWRESQREVRPLERPRRRWVDDIKIDLGGIDGVNWIGLAQNRDSEGIL
jgi:hypothetical protein